ncbi:hypothetical protein [Caulobacter sp. 17J80-11]|uniref:hypothetical protein n=1 Tax=Caulobacter sp. 17J80-11 TaxID=2763502 RepID=UPI0016534FB5|nr:hypothetical protein [Caulobacter sp. 17J80-11]MBC6980561.1 hypothetical protein [Caulobacter sp. 17J80-11]
MAATLLALALLFADPAAATSDAPVSTRAADAAPPSPAADILPQGAPADDFGFVAWCYGVLSGHMDLAERVQDKLPLDEAQTKIGRAYLAGYETALDAAPEGKTEAGRKRAMAEREDGWKKWDEARKVDHQLAADSYLAWQLPPRCEHAAQRLAGRKDIFRLNASVEHGGEADGPVGRPKS